MSTKEIPLFIMASELTIFNKRHPEYKKFERVYYQDGEQAGYLAYKD